MSFPGRALQKSWHLVDAKGQTVGRLANQISAILRGKHKPTFRPNGDMGDHIIVINAERVKLTANKWKTKIYRWHTGYPGGLKERKAIDMHERNPIKILRKAVLGMMRKTKLRYRMEDRLRIYPGPEHPHQAQLRGVEPLPKVPAALTGSFHFGLEHYAHPKSWLDRGSLKKKQEEAEGV